MPALPAVPPGGLLPGNGRAGRASRRDHGLREMGQEVVGMREYVFNPRVRNEIVRKMRRGMSVASAERTYGVPRAVLKAWLAEPTAEKKGVRR